MPTPTEDFAYLKAQSGKYDDYRNFSAEREAWDRVEAYLAKLEAALRPFARHRVCEDSWYSCPMSEDGCANDDAKGCTCGADQAIEALGQSDQGHTPSAGLDTPSE